MLHIYVDASYGPTVGSRGIGIHVLDHPKCNLAINLNCSNAVISRLELIGVYLVLVLTRDVKQVTIYTDSQHACQPLSDHYELYRSNDWTRANKKKSKIADYDLFVKCSDIIEDHRFQGHEIHIKKCEAHSIIYGNIVADELASCGMTNTVHKSGTKPFTMNINEDLSNIVADHTQIRDTIGVINNLTDLKVKEMPRFPSPPPAEVFDRNELPSVAKWPKPLGTLESISVQSNDADLVDEEGIKSDEVKEHNLFLLCMRCTKMICITYPSNHMINSYDGIAEMSICSIACTSCRTCITSPSTSGNLIDPFKTQDNLESSMGAIMISPSFIERSEYAQCAKNISGNIPHVMCTGEYTAFVRITDIMAKCDSTCRVVSVDVNGQKICSSLEFGFL